MIGARNFVVAVFLTISTASCVVSTGFCIAQSVSSHRPDGHPDLHEIPQPDLTGVDPLAVKQIRAAQAELAAVTAQAKAPRIHRAELFGRLGQIYQTYSFNDAALVCYSNAALLDSQSFRWSYYSGYLREVSGDTEAAVSDYQKALSVEPLNTPALLRLGNIELALNRPDAARQYFAKAMTQRDSSAAALTGLGKVALIEQQYALAIKYFNAALTRQPQASGIHYQLAMAYRGLGDLARVKEELRVRGSVEPTIRDPLLDEIEDLRQGKFALLERGTTAMRNGRFSDAVIAYRQAASLDPSDPLPYKYLGLALAISGEPDEALKQYTRSLQLDPNNATVQYNMGVLLIQERKEEQAVGNFRQALHLDPGLIAAHFQLANLFMRNRKDADAEREYGIVVSLQPQNGFARLMQAMAAVHSGSFAQARTLLDQSATALPQDADIANALARVLAAAPERSVRDPERALQIVEVLVSKQEGDPLEVGITLAMALAAAGRFQEAAAYQQAIISQLETDRRYDIARLMQRNLALYRQGKPCLLPWPSDDPIFTPVPSTSQLSMEAKTRTATP